MPACGGKMRTTDKRKQSFYLPGPMLEWLFAEAARQDRSMSWLIQRALTAAKPEIEKYPSAP